MTAIDTPDTRRIALAEVPWLPYGIVPGSHFRVLKVSERTNTVVLNFKMPANTVTPRHDHHCVATAYTISGEWFYDELRFCAGDLAFETPGEIHRPVTKEKPVELLTTLIGGAGNDRLLENYEDDGSSYILRTRFFKAFEQITLEDYKKLDVSSLLN